MKKRLLSVFMCFCMVLTMVPAAFASGTQDTPEPQSAQTEDQSTPASDDVQSEKNGNKGGERGLSDEDELSDEDDPSDTDVSTDNSADSTEDDSQDTSNSLPDAVDGVIKLENDITLTNAYQVAEGSSIELDLNGHTITINANVVGITVEGSGTKLTIKDSVGTGAISRGSSCSSTYTSGILEANDGGTIEMDAGTIDAVYNESDKSNKTGWYGVTVFNDSTFIMNGGEIKAGWAAVATNGTTNASSNTYGDNAKIVINDGKLTSSSDYAIYAPAQGGVTTINDGTIIGYWGAIQLKRGTLDINGGSFENNGVSTVTKPEDQPDGTTPDNAAAISLTSDYGVISAAISGGTFTAKNGNDAIKVTEKKNNKIDVSITGGTYSSEIAEDYLAIGYVCTKDDASGKYVVGVADGAQVETSTDEEGNVSATVDGSYSGNESSESGESGSISTDESGKITIDVVPSGSEATSISKVEVTVGTNALTSIDKADSVKEVELKTGVGTLTISDAAWSDMTAKATESGSDAGLVLTLANKSSGDGNPVYEVTAAINEENAFDGSGSGAVTISVPFAAESADTAKVFCIDGGKLEDMNATVSGEDSKTLTWSTTHFSSFGVVPYSTSDEPEVFYIQSGESGIQAQGGQFSDAAFAVGTNGGAITLNKDVTGSLVVTKGKTVTLDLNGYTLTNDGNATEKSHTITNNGTLTILDSSAGKTGTVDNVTHGKAALVNNEGGTATLNGGTFTRSQEKGASAGESGGNSYYTLENFGTMTINDGVTVKNVGAFSSMIHNGYYNGTGKTNTPELTINGGTFDGGLNTVKNDDCGKLEIKGGTFENTAQAVVLNWNDTAISGGTFTPKEGAGSVILNGRTTNDEGMDKGHLTISGGTFNGSDTVPVIMAMGTGDASKDNSGIIEISGGTLTGDIRLAYTESNPDNEVGSSLKISGSAVVDGDVINGGATEVTVKGGTVKGDITNQSSGEISISGGTVEGAVTNTGEGGTITVTGGSFTTADVSGFVNSDSAITITFDANGGTCGVKTMILTKNSGSATISNLPTPTRSGSYTFDGWYTSASGGSKVTMATAFSANTTLYAHWNYTGGSSGGGGGSSSGSYAITVDKTTGGTVKVSPSRADKGDTVTITVAPKNGYELDKLVVTDKHGDTVKLTDKGNGKYTFKMPASKVEIEVSFTLAADPDVSQPFVDVSPDAYYADAVAWAVENGITNGTSDTTFGPNISCTRAQMVTFLWRAAGSPKSAAGNPFTDVSSGAYYYEAVLWAVSEGITSGTSATTFAPDATVTRAQTVTFLYRAAGSPAVNGGSFADVPADAYYASAVAWAVNEGVTNGTGATTFSPDANCTRAQIVTFMYRAEH